MNPVWSLDECRVFLRDIEVTTESPVDYVGLVGAVRSILNSDSLTDAEKAFGARNMITAFDQLRKKRTADDYPPPAA